jgi:aminobenzoyl-glutamate utilization protein B
VTVAGQWDAATQRQHVSDGDERRAALADAEVYYYVRSPNREIVAEVWERVEKAATGAALGTGTKVEWEVTGGVYEMLPNEALSRTMHQNLTAVGGVTYTPEERAFAVKIGQTVFGKPPAPEAASVITAFNPNPPRESGGSTDVGDVSWTVPTVGLRAAAFAPGTPGHSWQAVACGGSSIGLKGMNVAAKSMAGMIVDLMTKPDLITQAKAEFTRRRGGDFKYVSLLGDRAPALNYRD